MLDVIIVGAGGFGREVYHWARAALPADEFRIAGFLDDDPAALDGFRIEAGVVGGILDEARPYEIKASDRFVCAIGSVDLKKKIVEGLRQRGARFLTLIHPTAVVADTASIGEGAVICPFALVSDSVVLGDFVMLNFYASCGHDAQVGRHCILSPYATLNGFAVLEDEVFMGTHSTVILYKKIGFRTRISANSVAMDDVKAHSFVYGSPGKSRVLFVPQNDED